MATNLLAPLIIAVDPGPEVSGWVVMNRQDAAVTEVDVLNNEEVAAKLESVSVGGRPGVTLAVEMIASYGKPVGRDVFETAVWIGEFRRAFRPKKTELVYRREVKRVLCGGDQYTDPRTLKRRGVSDAIIRQAVIDRYGGELVAIGGVKCPKCHGKGWFGSGRPTCPRCQGESWSVPPGPLHGLTTHCWQALACALTYAELNCDSDGMPK